MNKLAKIFAWYRKQPFIKRALLSIVTLLVVANAIAISSIKNESASSSYYNPSTTTSAALKNNTVQQKQSEEKKSATTSVNQSNSSVLKTPTTSIGCIKTNIVPYKTIVEKKDYMDKGETEYFGTGEDGYTETCPDKSGRMITVYVSAPLNVTEFVGTGVDAAQQQAANEQHIEIEKQQREVSAQNAGREAESDAYQSCVNIIGGAGGGDYSQCEDVGQNAYNNAYYNYLNSHPLYQ